MGAAASTQGSEASFATIEPHVIRALALSCKEGKKILERWPNSPENNGFLRDCSFNIDGLKGIFGSDSVDDRHVEAVSQFPRHNFLEAVIDGDLNTIKTLVEEDPGLLKRSKDRNGNTAAHIAASSDKLLLLEYVTSREPELLWLQNEVKNSPAHKAAESGAVSVLKYIKDKDPSLLDCKGAFGATPIHMAAKNGHLAVIAFLVEEDLSSLGLRDRRGSTVLHYAATHGHLQVVVWVANHRPSLVGDQNDQGDTPAHLAAASGKLEILRFLLSCDRTLLLTENRYGKRPSEVASAEHGCKEMLEAMECYTIGPGQQSSPAGDGLSSSAWSDQPDVPLSARSIGPGPGLPPAGSAAAAAAAASPFAASSVSPIMSRK